MSFLQSLKDAIKGNREIKYIVKHNSAGPKKQKRFKLRGSGYTRKIKEQSKARRKMAKASRRINRQRAH